MDRMPLRRVAVFVSVLAVGVLVSSGCGGDKPSGLPLYTPSPNGSSSQAPTTTSKWTAEQQKVIDGYSKYTDLRTALWTRTE
jgi:hypothetical protein